MKLIKKDMSLAMLVIGGLTVVPVAQAKSFSYYKDKAKSGAESAWKSTKSGFSKIGDQFTSMQKKATDVANNLDPKTVDKMKKALIGAGVGIGAAAGAVAVGYAVTEYDLFGSSGATNEAESVLASTVNMFQNDPKYRDDAVEQFRFLIDTDNDLDLDIDEVDHILDIANPGRG